MVVIEPSPKFIAPSVARLGFIKRELDKSQVVAIHGSVVSLNSSHDGREPNIADIDECWLDMIDPLLLSHALFQLGPHYAG